MRFAVMLYVLLWAAPLMCAEVKKEGWARGAASAAEAFFRYAPKRIGVLLVATDRRPDLGFRYAGRALHTEEREFSYSYHRMDRWYELRLYEAIREALREKGYEVRCLNRDAWEGLRLKEVMAQAEGIGAACVVHYGIQRTHAVLDRDGYSWWVPFEAMRLRIKCKIFDLSDGDLIYELEGETLGTGNLYTGLGEMVAEEQLHPSGYDRHGTDSAYKIAIYHTSLRDPKTGNRIIPMIRTAQGSLDISYVESLREVGGRLKNKDPLTGLDIMEQEEVREVSVLSRLLEHVMYRPAADEIEHFDLVSIEMFGKMVREKIPERRP